MSKYAKFWIETVISNIIIIASFLIAMNTSIEFMSGFFDEPNKLLLMIPFVGMFYYLVTRILKRFINGLALDTLWANRG